MYILKKRRAVVLKSNDLETVARAFVHQFRRDPDPQQMDLHHLKSFFALYTKPWKRGIYSIQFVVE